MSIYAKPKKPSKKKASEGESIYARPSPVASAGPEPVSAGPLDTVKDAAFAAAQGATFNFADEIYGGGRSLLEKGDLSAYEQHRDTAREAWARARERSPVATTAGEIGGAILSPGSKVMGAAKGLKGIIRGAAEGAVHSFGATDEDALSREALAETALGAGIGGGVGAIGNALTGGWNKSPTATRAEVIGTKSRDYRVSGPGDRVGAIQRASDDGLFRNRKMEFDVDSLKFKPTKKGVDGLERNTEENLLRRAQEAVDKIQVKKEHDFGPLLDNRYLPISELDKAVQEVADEYVERGLLKGAFSRGAAAANIKDNIRQHLMMQGEDLSRLSLRQVDGLKRMAQEDVRNFSKGLGELGDKDELARITARKLRELVENNIGTERFKKLNAAQHDYLKIAGDLEEKIRKMDLASPTRPQLEKTNFVESMWDSVTGGSQGRLDGAARKEWWESNAPGPLLHSVPSALQETPGALYRQEMQGGEGRGTWRDPSSAGPIENIPEQLIRTPLPRSSEELQAKRPFVLAKVAQMAPEMYEAVNDVFEHNPEQLGEMAQVLAMKMPHFFEKDKYNRFDGRILSEQDKARAIRDVQLRDDMNAIEQAKVITKLNKTGEFDL